MREGERDRDRQRTRGIPSEGGREREREREKAGIEREGYTVREGGRKRELGSEGGRESEKLKTLEVVLLFFPALSFSFHSSFPNSPCSIPARQNNCHKRLLSYTCIIIFVVGVDKQGCLFGTYLFG